MKHVSQFIPGFLKDLEEKIKNDDNQERREKSLQNITDIIAGRLAEKRKARFKKMKQEIWK